MALAESVRGFAEQARLTQAARGLADGGDDSALPQAWSALVAQELLSLPFDAQVSDLCVVVEELGRALAPGAIVPTLLAGLLVRQYGSDELKEHVATGLRDGTFSAAVSVNGNLIGGAGVSAVVVPLDGRWYVLDTAGRHVSSTPGTDPTRRIVHVDGLVPDPERLLVGLIDNEAIASAAVLLAAEATGVAAACLDIAVEYAKVREQFGQPIGAFQAVKHRCADMLATLELAGAAAWDAAHAFDEVPAGDPSRSIAVAVVGALTPTAAVEVAKSLIQVLGGIGFTWEHDAHLYLKRAMSIRQLLGRQARWHMAAASLARAGVRRSRTLDLGASAEPARSEVRKFLATLDGLGDAERRVAIADAGYLVPHWPAPYGRGAGPVEQLVIDEEFGKAGVARPDLIIGNWALPTILQHGTDAQRARFVPPTLHGRISWCQMFSEPGAGSDLASLSTKATRVDGGWSLSGQKVWTSAARTADWAICLARTSTGARRHDGITYFLVDMTTPGLDVRPLREITGDALFNEIFLTDVFVPDECVVGDVDGGWKLARTTLANERVAMSSGSAFSSGIEELLAIVETSGDSDDPLAMERVGDLVCRAQADAMLGARATLARVSGTDPGAASSVRKLVGMHLRQDAAELALEIIGPKVASLPDQTSVEAMRRMLSTRSLTIAGGTSEVLHNVIGERILGLPR
ncbi:MAG TPA: acyl-CoA dehydrogenase family protein [Mycobacteriales bacterium]|nr:acyl-CoA dehydrogenase family protein [Mycobacteriales bacterium]